VADCLIWSNEHGAWWAPDRTGYTTVIEAAGRYPQAQAERIVADATVGGRITVVREGPRGERLTVPTEVLVVLADIRLVDVPGLPLAHGREEETGG